MNKLQIRIFLGLAFLFLIIVALGVTGSVSIRSLAEDSGHIIEDNHMSAQYSVDMLNLLDRILSLESAGQYTDTLKTKKAALLFSDFEKLIDAESANVTEAGEADLVASLRKHYSRFREFYIILPAEGKKPRMTEGIYGEYFALRNVLYDIYRINTEAIQRRNIHARETADKVSFYMLVAGLTSSLIALMLILYLPRYLVRPIHELTGKMKKFTQREYNQATLSGSKDELENIASAFSVMAERDSAKTNLIATISHELKTPISSINLALKLLENEKVGSTNQEQLNIIQLIKEQTVRLSKMVNEMLDYAQAESGNIKLKIEPVSAADMIDYAAVAMVMIMAEKRIKLDSDIENELPDVYADIEKTVWVLVNLINNAVRYTEENGVVKITARRKENCVVISVIDQGPGLPPEEHDRIFNKFVKIGTGNPKGRGLGLAISKEFVLAQGGDIWIESRVGTGSTFSFRLPAVTGNRKTGI